MVKGIRGVNSDGVISSLVDKGLVRELGRDPQHGQAIIYGTTSAFLEKFGLRSTKDLPDLEQFAPDEQSRQFLRVSPVDLSSRRLRRPTTILKKNANSSIWKKTMPTA